MRSEPAAAPLEGAVVVLGVTGGIAAYKAVELCRRLVDGGATVLPVLTAAAERFVGAVSFSALGSEPARTSLFDDTDPIPHTRLARRADLILVAPATADFLGAYAAGLASDLLGTTMLASTAPVVCCPAMHAEMWEHPAVRQSCATLSSRGVTIVAPEDGHLAGGDEGPGRLADVATILKVASTVLAASRDRAHGRMGRPARSNDLASYRVLVSAGGTREPIDAVRYLANRSSGRQGHSIAEAAAARGASVVLVTASELAAPGGVEVVRVATAREMAGELLRRSGAADVVVMAAAVADFRPAEIAPGKLKRADGPPTIVLEPTQDILAALVAARRSGQLLVGFAAETESLETRAAAKLAAKGVDLLVANDVSQSGVGFGHETNAVTILSSDGMRIEVPLAPKLVVAHAVLDAVLAVLQRRAGPSGRSDRAE